MSAIYGGPRVRDCNRRGKQAYVLDQVKQLIRGVLRIAVGVELNWLTLKVAQSLHLELMFR